MEGKQVNRVGTKVTPFSGLYFNHGYYKNHHFNNYSYIVLLYTHDCIVDSNSQNSGQV